MKSFILYFVLATFVVNVYAGTQNWTKAEIESIAKIGEECQKISPITEKENEDIRDRDIISNSPAMKKHLGCVAKKVHLVKDNGEIDENLFRKKLELTNTKDKAQDIVKKCAIKKANPDETGYHLIKCAIENDSDFRPTGKPKS